jgi:hypothetical protein
MTKGATPQVQSAWTKTLPQTLPAAATNSLLAAALCCTVPTAATLFVDRLATPYNQLNTAGRTAVML